jgi:hypothetical protein
LSSCPPDIIRVKETDVLGRSSQAFAQERFSWAVISSFQRYYMQHSQGFAGTFVSKGELYNSRALRPKSFCKIGELYGTKAHLEPEDIDDS